MDKKSSLFSRISEEEKNAILFDKTGNFSEKAFKERISHYNDSLLNSFLLNYTPGPFSDYISEEMKFPKKHFFQKVDSSFKITYPKKLTFDLEKRRGQLNMMDDINEAIVSRNILIAEAPPGTGKSLAYLIPLIKNLGDSKRAVISTNTKNLQMQLFDKDLETASDYTGISVSASMLKGIGNYFCFMKYNENISNFSPLTKLALEGFLLFTNSGDLSELKYHHDLDMGDITCDNEYCVENTCPFSGICHYLKVKEKALTSQIVFTNHYLSLIDAELGNKFLGEYDCIVFDEAHNLENAITDIYSYKFDFLYVLKTMNYFTHTFRGQMKFIRSSNLSTDAVNYFENLLSTMNDAADEIDILYRFMLDIAETEKKERNEYSSRIFSGAEERVRLISGKLFAISDNADRGIKLLKEEKFRMLDIYQTLKYIFEKTNRFFESFAVDSHADNEEYAFFYEYILNRKNIILNGLPVDTGEPFLKAMLSRDDISFIFTSATLTASNSFEMFKKQTGINQTKRAHFENSYESSFNYEEQMKVICFKGMDDPNSDGFMDKASQIIQVLSSSEKRMFILATSYAQIDFLKKRFNDKRFLFQKKEENGDKLLHMHKQRKASILVGTNMFWEGVDLPGDLLETIIILKMPFAVPDDPIIRRRCSVMEENQIDPFREYTLPQAIIRLKQGMGRLIRKNDDKGEIYILDERILTKSYGKHVLGSFYVKPSVYNFQTFIEQRKEI